MSNDEQFFAWLDGELSAEEAARMHDHVAADPRLSQLASEHRAMQARLGQAFGSVLDAPVSERLHPRTPAGRAEVIDMAARKQSRAARRRPSFTQWKAMAATLAIGFLAGTLVSERESGSIEVEGSRVYAAATLGQALETRLASAPGGDVRIGLTFRDQSGKICRSFTQPQASGLACRAKGERWELRALFAAPEGQATEYRMAAGIDPNLANLIDATIAGDPLDEAHERAAKQARWR